MKKFVTLALVAGAALASISPAVARDGCGRGAHRGPYGHCRPDRGREVIAVGPNRLIVGNYYGGRGYWDGRRYYQHRERYNDGWRYR
ncbi:MAG: hypothetical protein JWL66_2675 [Sphingomonadales bacterium]|nr:hypothetical protein [Sphingomonadales bacterium]